MTLPDSMQRLNRLEVCDLSYNNFTDFPAVLKPVVQLPSFQCIQYAGNGVSQKEGRIWLCSLLMTTSGETGQYDLADKAAKKVSVCCWDDVYPGVAWHSFARKLDIIFSAVGERVPADLLSRIKSTESDAWLNDFLLAYLRLTRFDDQPPVDESERLVAFIKKMVEKPELFQLAKNCTVKLDALSHSDDAHKALDKIEAGFVAVEKLESGDVNEVIKLYPGIIKTNVPPVDSAENIRQRAEDLTKWEHYASEVKQSYELTYDSLCQRYGHQLSKAKEKLPEDDCRAESDVIRRQWGKAIKHELVCSAMRLVNFSTW